MVAPSEILYNFHLSFPDVPQVLQRFRFTHGIQQRMESQITWTAMSMDSTHLRLKLICWRMDRRWKRSSQTCLSARTGRSIFWCTQISLPVQWMSTAAVWITAVSLCPIWLSGIETTNQHHGGLKMPHLNWTNSKLFLLFFLNTYMLVCFMYTNWEDILMLT